MGADLLFGPVKSRRLGRSLGIEMVPKKICSMDCVYCEVGKTTFLTFERGTYHPWEKIELSIVEAKKVENFFDFFTFTGSGEPTLNVYFKEAIDLARKILSKPIAVLTNSTLIYFEDVKEALCKVDVVLPSLDVATQETFVKLNRPVPNLKIEDIIKGLEHLRQKMRGEMWLEIFLVKGFNDSEEEILRLKKVIEKINPHKIQLNTVVRPPAYPIAKPVSFEKLQKIAKYLGEKAEIIVEKEKIEKFEKPFKLRENLEEAILKYLQIRPATFEELSEVFQLSLDELKFLLEKLYSLNKVETKKLENKIFYIAK